MSDLINVKPHINIVILDIMYCYICMDNQYFYLNNRMDQEESIMIQTSIILE